MIFDNEFAFLSYILKVKNIMTIYLGILMLWNFKKKYVYVLSWDKKVCHAFLHHKVLFEKKWCIRDSNGRDIIKNTLMVLIFFCKYIYRTILLLMSMIHSILSKALVWFFFFWRIRLSNVLFYEKSSSLFIAFWNEILLDGHVFKAY